MDIRDFIAARLDERERALPSALPGPWSTEVDRGKMQKSLGESEGHYLLRADDGALVAESVRGNALLHLRGHDPVWARADITAKRQILGAYDRATARFDEALSSPPDTDADASAFSARSHMDLVLRLLAAIDADHSDFNPAWKLDVS